MIKMSALYCLASTSIALLAISFGWAVQFDMQDIMTPSHIWRMAAIQGVLILGLITGYGIARRLPRIRVGRFKNFSMDKWHIPSVLFLLFFAMNVTLSSLQSLSIERLGGGLERTMHGKGTQIMLVICAILCISNVEKKKFEFISVSLVFYSAMLHAVFNGSRSSIIPVFIILLYYMTKGLKGKSIITLACFAIVFISSMIGRVVVSSYSFNFSDLIALNFSEMFYSGLLYFTAFSSMHAAYAIDYSGLHVFGWRELLYSITPLPSFIWAPPSDPNGWRVDQFRPLGAQAEMWGISPILNLIASGIVGFLIERSSRIQQFPVKFMAQILLITSFMISFQYGLRSVQWAIWLAFWMITFFCNFERRNLNS